VNALAAMSRDDQILSAQVSLEPFRIHCKIDGGDY
jgi:hypothetical protein